MLSQVFRRKEDFLVLLYVLIRIIFWCFSRCFSKDWIPIFLFFYDVKLAVFCLSRFCLPICPFSEMELVAIHPHDDYIQG